MHDHRAGEVWGKIYLVASLADLVSTVLAVELWGSVEVNPVLSWAMRHSWATFAVVKMGLTALILWGLLQYRPRLLGVVACALSCVAGLNIFLGVWFSG